MDKATLHKTCDNFARVCIKVNLSKPFALKSWMRWCIYRVEYKAIYFVCFYFGIYRYKIEKYSIQHIRLDNL